MKRTIPFRDILWGVAKRDGQIPESMDLTPEIAVQMAEGINTAYRYAWEYFDWPEACEYAALSPALHPGSGLPWLSYVQELPLLGRVELGTVLGAYCGNPLAHPGCEPGEIDFMLGPDGLYFPEGRDGRPLWLRYRPEPPVFTAVAWDEERAYGPGEVVYWPEAGHCYRALLASPPGTWLLDTTFWAEQTPLRCLADAVKAGAFALYLGGDGQAAASGFLAEAMTELLDTQVCLVTDQMNQRKRLRR